MSKELDKTHQGAPAQPAQPTQADLDTVLGLIEAARTRAVAAVNAELVELYWSIGRYINGKIAEDGWGRGTVEALAEAIQRQRPTARGYSARNLWRMMQFFDTYRNEPKLATVLRELSWSHNLAIMSRCKRPEEREFYLRTAICQRWSFRELERQLAGALFERTVLSPPKLSTPLAELHPSAAEVFRDTYMVEFLNLPPGHSEADLQRGLVEQLKVFLIPRVLRTGPATGHHRGRGGRMSPPAGRQFHRNTHLSTRRLWSTRHLLA